MPETAPSSNQWTVRALVCPHCQWRATWVVRKTDRYLACPYCKKPARVIPPRTYRS